VALLAGFLSLFPAAALWALARLGQSSPVWVRLLLLAPALWTVSEWLRGWVFTGFPWLSLGDSQAPDGWLAPLAPVVGHFGLSGLLVLASGLLVLVAQAICRRQRTAACSAWPGNGRSGDARP
jgi:apolipoprotein N-acyltransferase